MNIYAEEGTRVVFKGDASQSQIQWGGHQDPTGLLVPGETYTIDRIEVRSYHTKVYLVDYQGKSFNSVWFDEI